MTLILAMLMALQDRGGKIEWRHDFDEALRDAKRTCRPAMLYFTDDG